MLNSRLGVPILVAALVLLLLPASATAAPVISRGHFEFSVRVDDCGIGTLDLSIDVFGLLNSRNSPEGTFFDKFTVVDVGTAFDAATGITYRFVDRFTQTFIFRTDQPFVNSAERTLVITGDQGGLLARGLVHTTILPDGTMVSDRELQFVHCL